MTIMKSLTAAILAGLLGAPLAMSTADAKDFRYATGFAPNSTGTKDAELYAKKAKEISNGDLNIKVFAQSLLSFTEMSAGVRDKIADIGMVLFPYFPAEYPNATMISEMTMMFGLQDNKDNRAGLAWAGAYAEYIALNCPKCLEDLKKQNQVFTGTSSTEYMLMCMKRVEKPEDMKGVRIRAPGAHWTRWAQSLGATSVAVPQNEIFEGLSQGILDCSLSGAAELVDLSLIDAVKFIIRDVPGGGFGGTGLSNVNADVWKSLSPEQRRNLLRAGVYHGALNSWDYRTNNELALKKAEQKGIKIISPTPEFVAKSREFTNGDLQAIAKNYSTKYSLTDTDKSVATMRNLYQKWVGLVAKVDSADALSDLIWNEAFSKVDVNSYGL